MNSPEYWMLADDRDGVVSKDGPHGDPSGVVEAMKIHQVIWPGRHRDFRMLVKEQGETREVPIPELSVAINEDAARQCRMMVQRASR